MIGQLWGTLREALITEGGHDRLVEFLETALAFALVERAKYEERRRVKGSLQ